MGEVSMERIDYDTRVNPFCMTRPFALADTPKVVQGALSLPTNATTE